MTAKLIEQKTIELLLASPVLCSNRGLLSKTADGDSWCVFNNVHAPVGNRFPQLNLQFNYGSSEEVLPAERMTIIVTGYCQQNQSQPRLLLHRIFTEVEGIFNKNPAVFEEIDISVNEGLRVVQFLRVSKNDGYDEDYELFYENGVYQVVKSEGEDFTTNYGSPETEWP